MPLYEYACEKCGHHFEKIEHVDAPEVKKCPKCGGKAPRLLSAPAIQFKGTGWYVTDYAGKNSDSASRDASRDGSSKSDDKGGSDASSNSSASSKKTESAKESGSKSKSKKKE